MKRTFALSFVVALVLIAGCSSPIAPTPQVSVTYPGGSFVYRRTQVDMPDLVDKKVFLIVKTKTGNKIETVLNVILARTGEDTWTCDQPVMLVTGVEYQVYAVDLARRVDDGVCVGREISFNNRVLTRLIKTEDGEAALLYLTSADGDLK